MKILAIFSIIILFSLPSYGFLSQRELAHKKAEEEFLKTHFFENGRGMTISPDMSRFLGGISRESGKEGFVNNIIKGRYGFVLKDNQDLMGVFGVKYEGKEVAVLGCTACHSGRAAGILVPGLGNKTIDPYMIGKDAYRVQRIWGIGGFRNSKLKYVHEKSLNFAKTISDKRISNLTKGLVPDSVIKTFFYKDNGVAYPKNMGRAQIKVPALWGFAEKRLIGVFADNGMNSVNYGWVFGAELFASDSAEHLRAVLPKLKHVVDNVVGNLLPPKYPFKIDKVLAQKGEQIVKKTCFKCHGDHKRGSDGHPIYEVPKVISQDIVGTDKDRLNAIDDDFKNQVAKSSLGDLLFFNEDQVGKGYFAPKLWGIWSRFPYLHNGSVPTLYHLMIEPSKRPKAFSIVEAGSKKRFDTKFVGLTMLNPRRDFRKGRSGDRNFYFIKRDGHSNKGHYFPFMKKLTEAERMSIVEFLKTL